MIEKMFEKAKIEKRLTVGLFPIKKVDKDAIVPINVISFKLFQHQHRPEKCLCPPCCKFRFFEDRTEFCILVPRKPMSED